MEELTIAIDSLIEEGISVFEVIGFLEIIKSQLVNDLLLAEEGED